MTQQQNWREKWTDLCVAIEGSLFHTHHFGRHCSWSKCLVCVFGWVGFCCFWVLVCVVLCLFLLFVFCVVLILFFTRASRHVVTRVRYTMYQLPKSAGSFAIPSWGNDRQSCDGAFGDRKKKQCPDVKGQGSPSGTRCIRTTNCSRNARRIHPKNLTQWSVSARRLEVWAWLAATRFTHSFHVHTILSRKHLLMLPAGGGVVPQKNVC